ncbi:MAG: hypothetical protein HZB56_10270 [Deltaproteobacteria bacterium]|nr:hypothetical protein [Deltaproteobacteria bacterium]
MQLAKTNTASTNNKNTTTSTFTFGNSMRGRLSPPNARSVGGGLGNPLVLYGDASLGASDAFATNGSGARHA